MRFMQAFHDENTCIWHVISWMRALDCSIAPGIAICQVLWSLFVCYEAAVELEEMDLLCH